MSKIKKKITIYTTTFKRKKKLSHTLLFAQTKKIMRNEWSAPPPGLLKINFDGFI